MTHRGIVIACATRQRRTCNTGHRILRRPNVRANRGSGGGTPWPDSRQCTVAAGGPRWPAVAAPVERGVRPRRKLRRRVRSESWETLAQPSACAQRPQRSPHFSCLFAHCRPIVTALPTRVAAAARVELYRRCLHHLVRVPQVWLKAWGSQPGLALQDLLLQILRAVLLGFARHPIPDE